MTDEEREQHDQAWGLNFPSPGTVLTPERNQKFEDVIATLLSEQIAKDPATVEAISTMAGRFFTWKRSMVGHRQSACFWIMGQALQLVVIAVGRHSTTLDRCSGPMWLHCLKTNKRLHRIAQRPPATHAAARIRPRDP